MVSVCDENVKSCGIAGVGSSDIIGTPPVHESCTDDHATGLGGDSVQVAKARDRMPTFHEGIYVQAKCCVVVYYFPPIFFGRILI